MNETKTSADKYFCKKYNNPTPNLFESIFLQYQQLNMKASWITV